MPASIQEVKRKISSTKKTGQITTAMQMVSTAKLNQIQKHTTTYQVYASKIRNVITHLAASHLLDDVEAPEIVEEGEVNSLAMLQQRPVKKTGLVVITSDRGLVGSYNSNVIKQTMGLISKNHHSKDDIEIVAIGGTGADFFKKRGYDIVYEYRELSDVPTFREVRPIVRAILKMFESEKFDELFVCYNHFVNSLTSTFRGEQMLPISAENLGSEGLSDTNDSGYNLEYDTEPSEDAILEVILPQYAESLLYGAMLDAKTSEHASSSTAMRSASDNANDIIAGLELQYNRARQSAITTEITEITGAQAALE